jgi:hypothetical protein
LREQANRTIPDAPDLTRLSPRSGEAEIMTAVVAVPVIAKALPRTLEPALFSNDAAKV